MWPSISNVGTDRFPSVAWITTWSAPGTSSIFISSNVIPLSAKNRLAARQSLHEVVVYILILAITGLPDLLILTNHGGDKFWLYSLIPSSVIQASTFIPN